MVKVGDKVRVTVDKWTSCPRGSVCAVEEVLNNSGSITASTDCGDGFDWCFLVGEYEPITTPQTGTLQELNVKPGDVVECVDNLVARDSLTIGMRYKCKTTGMVVDDDGDEFPWSCARFRIISRASDYTPKLWRDMIDAEKGALLLAHQEGKVIECRAIRDLWVEKSHHGFLGECCYRIKPEPKRETVELYGKYPTEHRWGKYLIGDTHRITFDTEDGEPVCDSIKMERL